MQTSHLEFVFQALTGLITARYFSVKTPTSPTPPVGDEEEAAKPAGSGGADFGPSQTVLARRQGFLDNASDKTKIDSGWTEMGMLYWLGVWFMMAAAFTTAWAFIVKGCEALDDRNASEEHG